MRNKVKNYKSYILLFILVTLIATTIFLPYILKNEVFYLGWDMRTQYSSFFEELRTILHNAISSRKIPFYSWNYFLGNDFYSSKLFYYHDFFDWFFALATSWSYSKVIIAETYLKFLISASTFYLYVKYNSYNDKTCIIGSLMFAFSAYGIQIMMHPFFATFYCFVPLYFLSVDIYLKNGKKIYYILSSFLLVVINYYLFYTTSIFTIIYFIYRYYTINKTCKKVILKALPLIGCYFIAIMMSAVVLLPQVLSLLNNTRVGSSETSLLIYDSIKPYLEIFTGIFTPTSAIANRNDEIGNIYSYTSNNNSLMQVFLWCSSIVTLLLPQIYKDKKENRVLIIICLVLSLIPVFGSILHGFSDPSFRWLFLPSFMLIIFSLDYINDTKKIDGKLLKTSLWLFIVLLIVSTPIMALLEDIELNKITKEYIIILFISIPFVLLIYKTIKSKYLLAILVVEIITVSYYSYANNPMFSGMNKNNIYSVNHVLGNKNDLSNYLNYMNEENITSFYRIYVDPSAIYWDYSTNYNLNYNYMGVLSYDTTYEYNLDKMRSISSISTYLPWAFDIRDDKLLDTLSIKYALVTDEKQLPINGSYELVGDFNSIFVYENSDYINLGRTYDKITDYENSDLECVIADEGDIEAIKSYIGSDIKQFDIVKKDLNYLYANIILNDKGFAVLSIPYNKGWNIRINDKNSEYYCVNGGLIGIPLTNGYNEIEMTFTSIGFKQGAIISILGLIMMIIVGYFEKGVKKR